MPELAPIEHIRDYYEGSLSKAADFPREYGFYQSFLSYVTGPSVLNVGAAPCSTKTYNWNSIHVSAYKKGPD